MPRKRIVPEAPPTETYQPTDTITLDIADGRVVAYEALPETDRHEKPQRSVSDLRMAQTEAQNV